MKKYIKPLIVDEIVEIEDIIAESDFHESGEGNMEGED